MRSIRPKPNDKPPQPCGSGGTAQGIARRKGAQRFAGGGGAIMQLSHWMVTDWWRESRMNMSGLTCFKQVRKRLGRVALVWPCEDTLLQFY